MDTVNEEKGKIEVKGEEKNQDKVLEKVSVKKKFEDRKVVLDKSIAHYMTLNIDSRANLNCEELSPVRS